MLARVLALTATVFLTHAPARAQVRTGIDVLAANGCAPLHGRKLGLITNQTGRTADGKRPVDVLRACKYVTLVALFSPEHGWEGAVDENHVADTTDAATGLRVYSLYGDTRTP